MRSLNPKCSHLTEEKDPADCREVVGTSSVVIEVGVVRSLEVTIRNNGSSLPFFLMAGPVRPVNPVKKCEMMRVNLPTRILSFGKTN